MFSRYKILSRVMREEARRQYRIKHRYVAGFVILLMIFASFVPTFQHSVYSDEPGLIQLNVLVDKTNVQVGETFTYTIQYSYSGANFSGERIHLTLPDPLEYIDAEPSADIQSIDASGSPIIIHMNNMSAGTTGFFKANVRFRSGSITESTTRTSHVQNGGGNVTPDVPAVTASVNTDWTWNLTKEQYSPASSITPALGGSVTYRIRAYGNLLEGGWDIADALLVDQLPVGSEFISATDGGVYSSEVGTVTWNIGALPAGETRTYYVTIRYPSESFNQGDVVTNECKLTGIGLLGELEELNKLVSHSLVGPQPGIGGLSKSSRQANDRYSIGQEVRFTISGFSNTGNIPINSLTIIDTMPDGIDLQSATQGQAHTVSYMVYGGSEWVTWGTPSSKPDLGSGFIQQVRWEFSDLPIGFSPTGLQVTGELLSHYRETGAAGNPVVNGHTITNQVSLQATSDGACGVSCNQTASVTITVADERPWLSVNKTVDKPTAYEEETVTYTVRIRNHQYATGDLNMFGGQSITVNDTLPTELDEFIYIGSSGTANNLGTVTPSVSGNDKIWTLTDLQLEPGQYVDIQYSAKIKTGTEVGIIQNSVTSSTPAIVLDGRTGDLSGHANVFVKFKGSLKSVKGIRGQGESAFEYPQDIDNPPQLIEDTYHGGIVDYQVRVSNDDANGPITNVVLIDKLPRIGDTGVIVPAARGTEWVPYLVAGVTGENGLPLPAGVTIYYSTSNNPSLQKLNNPLGGFGSGWSTQLPEDITTVTHIGFDFGSIVFNPNDLTIILEWSMRAPVYAPVGEIAWNSFAYGATYQDINSEGTIIQQPFLPAEPLKVGMRVADNPSPTRYSLGDFIWHDVNKNGLQDPGEPGINGILVNLYKNGDFSSPYAFTRTGYSDTGEEIGGQPGYYLFSDLEPANYVVEFETPNDYHITDFQVGAGASPEIDSDFIHPIGNRYRTDSITLSADNMTVDAGLFQQATIGDYVWLDRNRDGVQNSGEPGIENVSVKLLNAADDSEISSTTTNANGAYSFANIDPGQYKVQFLRPSADFVFSPANQGGDATTNSRQVDGAGITTDIITINSAQSVTNIDVGMYLAEIGDRVWHDSNANGIQNGSEPNINNVTVRLWEADGVTEVTNAFGVTVGAITTNSSGQYLFRDLKAGTYIVEFDKPAPYNAFSPEQQGGDSSVDSNANVVTGRTEVITLTAGERNLTIDAGMYRYASVGDYVWSDWNRNGVQNPGEPGIANITVRLLTDADVVLQETTTNVSGNYLFNNLTPGAFKVEFVRPSDAYAFTTAEVGTAATNSDVTEQVGLVGKTSAFTLTSGQNRTDIDAGMYLGRIGDRVWEDMNANGIQDAGELGINGVSVRLRDDLGNEVSNAFGVTVSAITTNSSGNYYFNDLLPGSYVVEFIKPGAFHAFSPDGQGAAISDSNVTSFPDDNGTIIGRTDPIILAPAGIDLTIDAGMYKLASIGDRVWRDTNANGRQDAGELGIAGVTVNLLDGNGDPIVVGGNPVTTVTDGNGNYSFSNLTPGGYRVQFINPDNEQLVFTTPNVGNDTEDSDAIPNDDHTLAITAVYALQSGENNITVDAGLHQILPNIEVVKTVYRGSYDEDLTGNNLIAIQDDNTTVTYLFTVTNTGNTYVRNITIVDTDLEIDQTNMTHKSGPTTFFLAPGQSLTYYYQTSLSESFVNQVTARGTPTFDEYAIPIPDMAQPTDNDTAEVIRVVPGIELEKTVYAGHDGGAQTGNKLLTGTIGDSITYVFTITNTGEHYVTDISLVDDDILIGGIPITQANMQLVGDPTPITPGAIRVYYYETVITGDLENNARVEASPCQEDGTLYVDVNKPTDVSSSLVQLFASLGDTVWFDLDGNGAEDIGEPGASGIPVSLYQSGTNIADTTTNGSGEYLFTHLIPGVYAVRINHSPSLDGYQQSFDLDGTLDHETSVTLTSGQVFLDADFGYQPIPDISIAKTANSALARTDEVIEFTITVVNTGKTELTNIIVKDEMLQIDELVPLLLVDEVFTVTGSAIMVTSNIVNTVTVESDQTPEVTATWTVVYQPPPPPPPFGGGGGGYIPPVPVIPLPPVPVPTIPIPVPVQPPVPIIPVPVQPPIVQPEQPPGGPVMPGDTPTSDTPESSELLPKQPSESSVAGLEGYIWIDLNQDGVIDHNEMGINEVVINIYNMAGELVATTVTSTKDGVSGYYSTEGLPYGEYTIKAVLPGTTIEVVISESIVLNADVKSARVDAPVIEYQGMYALPKTGENKDNRPLIGWILVVLSGLVILLYRRRSIK